MRSRLRHRHRRQDRRPQSAARPNPHAAVDAALASIALGNIAFNAPTALNVRESAEIELLLSLEKSIGELQQAVAAAGERHGAQVRVSNRMEARLSGPGFGITAITPEEQAVGSTGTTQWKWEVKPKAAGSHRLHLTLTALFDVEGTDMRRAIRTFDHTIDVRVTWGQRVSSFVAENWQWLWAVFLVPLAGWLWGLYKRRRA